MILSVCLFVEILRHVNCDWWMCSCRQAFVFLKSRTYFILRDGNIPGEIYIHKYSILPLDLIPIVNLSSPYFLLSV
jgi:hypothetical protein